MAELTEVIMTDDDPIITVWLDDSTYGDSLGDEPWEIPKSNLIKYSGFFRRMFKYDWKETRENKVTIHDSEKWETWHLMEWLKVGYVVDLRYDDLYDPGDYEKDQLHHDAVNVFELVDRYDCPDFRSDCLDLIAKYLKMCLEQEGTLSWGGPAEDWNADHFMEKHYETLKRVNGGAYPEELYSVFAETWWFFSAKDAATAKLDAALDDDHALAVAVAKSCRIRSLATKKSMEAFQEWESDSD